MKTHTTEHRVRHSDTDHLGGAYYASYLRWFEIGRIELLRSSGVIYSEIEKKGFYLPIVELKVRYLKPVKYDELLILKTTITKIGNSSIRCKYKLYRKEDMKLLAEASTTHVLTDKKSNSRKIPESLRKLI